MDQASCTQTPVSIVTSIFTYDSDDNYDARAKYQRGEYVVGLIFRNIGDGPIQFQFGFKRVLEPGDSPLVLPIPNGYATAQIFQWHMNPNTRNLLEITETTIVKVK